MIGFSTGLQYFSRINEIFQEVISNQLSTLSTVAKLWADTISNGNCIFVFGCTHAGIISEELFYRAGGLVPINPIFHPAMLSHIKPITLTSRCERISGLGQALAAETPFNIGDVLLLHSVSGRNAVPIDMAIAAKERGVITIALTNKKYSAAQPARHTSSQRLYEVCDYCLDNCGDFADAAIALPGFEQKVAATSTVIGAAIVNAIVAETCAQLLAAGFAPPVFHSANADGGDEINQKLIKHYGKQLTYI